MKNQFTKPTLIIIIFLLCFFAFNFLKTELLDFLGTQGYTSIDIKHAVIIGFNTVYAIISLWLIKRYRLIDLAGLGKKFKFKNWFLLLFPLYLVILNIPYPEDINLEGVTVLNYVLLVAWSISVGFSEELMLRGFTQSMLLTKYGRTKKGIYFSVIGAAMIFGLLHLLKFDKGLYGEISQVFFATFIGTMFGAILLRTNKLWPLIVLHALIDLAGNLDKLERKENLLDTTNGVTASTVGMADALILTIVVIPCFIYGLILLRKVKTEDVVVKI
ncbi:CPBP family intramembrane glutamic endopeptidase [Lacinutrix chionoecetis]